MLNRYHRQFYGGSDFYNFGYWDQDTRTLGEASTNLVRTLLARLPTEGSHLLDIACGLGASTRLVLQQGGYAEVTAVNISEVQLQRARSNAVAANLARADAVNLPFADASFDALLCVEAAFHFDSREAFFGEALRVLKPHGWLALSDILLMPGTRADATWHFPAVNYLSGVDSYGERMAALGFERVRVEDATSRTWGRCRVYTREWPHQERRAGRLSLPEYLIAQVTMRYLRRYWDRLVRHYVIAAAMKPGG
jgi:ubiquinone/menaquinone biosynthesis C-methylase UbiE